MSQYKKLKLNNLQLGKWYIFYKTDGKTFKAKFYGLTKTVLLVKHYIADGGADDPITIRSMPRDWVDYAESEEFKIQINNFIS